MAIFEDYLGDLDCSNSYDWVKDKPKQNLESAEYKKREIDSLKRRSKEIIKMTFNKYPEKLIDVLADNNTMHIIDTDEYVIKRSLEKGLELYPWIFIGNNAEKLITELSAIAEDINFISSYSSRFSSLYMVDSKSELEVPNAAKDPHIINIEVIINKVSYKITLVFKKSYSSRTSFYNASNVYANRLFERFTKAEEVIKSLTRDKNNLRLKAIEKFVKECRKDVGRLIFCGENNRG